MHTAAHRPWPVRLHDHLDDAATAQARVRLEHCVIRGELRLDLLGVTQLSPAAVSLLVRLGRLADEGPGRLVLLNVPGHLEQLLNLAGVGSLADIHPAL